VRAERGGTKKLILAFHFQFADQAGWKCEECRRSGLEEKRRCALRPGAEQQPNRVVWVRNGAVAERCPKSLITGESLALIEAYCAWKLNGGGDYRDMSAREVEAFWVLEQELRKEMERRGDE